MRNSIITLLEFKDGIYQGQTLQQRYKQGLGLYLWENGSAYYGEWKSDQIDGNGILFLPPKYTIQAQFSNSKLNGNCVLQTRQGTYKGQWLNGIPNGPITATFPTGEVTITFQDGKPIRGPTPRQTKFEIPNLKSTQCYNNSAIQHISFQDGTFYGITTKNSIHQIIPNGLGVLVQKDGLFQCGQFKDGQLNGLGRFQQQSGEIYQGFFENGKYNGKAIYLFKDDEELQWLKGLWRYGSLIEIYQNGKVKDCTSPQDLMFPYSDRKNPIRITQPFNLNNIKELEDLFLSQFQIQQPIQNQTSPSPLKQSKLSSHKYFSMSNSYQRISDAINKQPTSPQRNSQQLIKYYKGQLQDIDINEQPIQKSQQKSQQKSKSKQKSLNKSSSNSKKFITSNQQLEKSSSKLSQSAYVEEIKKLQTQFTKPFDHNKSVQSQQSQIYQTVLDSEERSSQRSDLFHDKQQHQQQSPKDHIEQIIQKSKQFQKDQSIEQSRKSIEQSRKSIDQQQSRKSIVNQSRQSNLSPKSKQSKSPKSQLAQSRNSNQSKCKSTEGNRKSIQQEINKIKSEGNKPIQEQDLDISQQSKQEQNLIQDSTIKQRESRKSQDSSQVYSQRISIKSNTGLSQQQTPQQSHREQQIEQNQQKPQDVDHNKKLSFCQQDFAQDIMRNTAIFNQPDSNQSTQMKFHKHKRSYSQSEQLEIEDPQMKLVKQQQLYMQQLIEQQQKQLEQLKQQQQQLEEENQIGKPSNKQNISMDSLESYPQHSESFHQDFIKSVSDVLKNELKRKQDDSLIRDQQNNSPHFEQSKITNNNQQSLFINDFQSLDNVNVNDKNIQRKISQQDDNKSKADSSIIRKQPISHSELDDIQFDKQQDNQSRQSRNSRYSIDDKKQRSQSQQSSKRNYSIQQHSFHQQQSQQQSQEQFYPQKQQSIIQDKDQSQQFKESQQIQSQKNLSYKDEDEQLSIMSSQVQEIKQNFNKKQQIDDSFQSKEKVLQQQTNTVQKNLPNQQQQKIVKQIKQQSGTQLKYVATSSQQSIPYQAFQSDKQLQIKPDQQSENFQVSIADDQSETKQNIQEIKMQLAAQKELLSQLYHSIQESKLMKVSQFESEKRISEQRTIKRSFASPSYDPCSSPIKKVIITKGAYPAFTIIKSLSPIRI